MANLIKQLSAVTSGTVTAQDTQQDIIVFHDAASLAVSMTLALPATPVDGQRVIMVSRLGVTALSTTSALTIVGTVTTIAAADAIEYIYESSANKWYKIR